MVKVLSLFDGISCGMVAFDRAGIPVEEYHACEIDKYTIQISQKNYPAIVRHGSVVDYHPDRHFDYLIGGSPCQGFSFAGKQLAFNDPRSKLFFEYVRILKECRAINPNIKFLLENVKMKKEHLAAIDETMGVKGHLINSALVSAQNRQRYYWYNWFVEVPEDKGVLLRDIIEDGAVDREKAYCIDANYYKGGNEKSYFEKGRRQLVGISETENGIRPYKNDGRKGSFSEIGTINLESGKSSCISSAQANGQTLFAENGITFRKLTVTECERLQTLPDGYTEGVSSTQRYKALGNGWTVDVIAHILRGSK